MNDTELATARELWMRKFTDISGLAAVSNADFKIAADEMLKSYSDLIDRHRTEHSTLYSLAQRLVITPSNKYQLTKGQLGALEGLKSWLGSGQKFFVLKGYAGTGKTYIVGEFAQQLDPEKTLFTAPTNQATKILRTLLPEYNCRTIYSALSLKMVEREDERVLEPSDDKFSLRGFTTIVVDESSMLNSEVLSYIITASNTFGIRFLFVLDDAQLPPVGEDLSPVVELDCASFELTEVVRHDNQILELATHVRDHIKRRKKLKPLDFESTDRSVWRLSRPAFLERLRTAAKSGFHNMRAIAWRNRTVDLMNDVVRSSIYTPSDLESSMWLPNEPIVFTAPISEGRQQIATTDDKAVVQNSSMGVDMRTGLKCYFVQAKLDFDNTVVRMRVLHEDSVPEFKDKLADLAYEARKPKNGKMWGRFWELHDRFHSIRHAYALTAHRSQGSTVGVAFVDCGDILANPDMPTAYRCLYVAVSRPSERLYTTGLPI